MTADELRAADLATPDGCVMVCYYRDPRTAGQYGPTDPGWRRAGVFLALHELKAGGYGAALGSFTRVIPIEHIESTEYQCRPPTTR